MTPAFMQSLLLQQLEILGDLFARRYASPWLVWEADAWRAPRQNGETLELHAHAAAGASAQALCFMLELKPGRSEFSIGRAPGNDLVVNDGTVSRRHAVLGRTSVGWELRPQPDSALTRVGAREVRPGDWVALRDQTSIVLGNAVLTFLEPRSMETRLKLCASFLARKAAPLTGAAPTGR